MKIHLLIYSLNIMKDLKYLLRSYQQAKDSNIQMSYLSDSLGKLQLSVEMIYDVLYSSELKKSEIFKKKKLLLFALQLVVSFFKLKELKQLKSLDFGFYVEKPIFNGFILSQTDDEIFEKLGSQFEDNELDIRNNKSLKLFKLIGKEKVTIPERVLELVRRNPHGVGRRDTRETLVGFLLGCVRNLDGIVEVLYLLKPVVYMFLLLLLEQKSMKPIVFMLLVDLLVIVLYRRKEGRFSNQMVYNLERKYRLNSLYVYFMRQPIFALVTKPFIIRMLGFFRMPESVVNVVVMVLEYYTYLHYTL